MSRWSDADERHWWTALTDLAERRIEAVFAKRHLIGRPYDPQQGSAGAGQTCSKCRRIFREDVRVCPSCGTIAP